MLENGWRRWALPATLVGLLALSASVAALSSPSPGDAGGRAAQAANDQGTWAQQTARDTVRDVTNHGPDGSGSLLPPGAPGAPAPPSQPGTPAVPAPPSVPPMPASLARILARLQAVLPTDPVGLALGLATKAGHDVERALPPVPALGASPSDGPESTGSAPQTAATVPVGNLAIDGSILVVGATAAAAAVVVAWLAGSSGTIGASAASASTPELRRLLPFASPLFTRFERDTVLGHPRREQLYALVLQEPGISLQDLGQATGLSRTAVVHHLRLLEQQHLVISRRVGRSRHYYENGGRYGHDQKEAYAILRNERSRAVADYIKAHPGTMQKSLCEALAIPPSIAHWHVRRLSEGGIVQSIRQGRTVAYFPGVQLQTPTPAGALAAVSAAPTA